jgi:hypothetical protein
LAPYFSAFIPYSALCGFGLKFAPTVIIIILWPARADMELYHPDYLEKKTKNHLKKHSEIISGLFFQTGSFRWQ